MDIIIATGKDCRVIYSHQQYEQLWRKRFNGDDMLLMLGQPIEYDELDKRIREHFRESRNYLLDIKKLNGDYKEDGVLIPDIYRLTEIITE